MATTKKPAAKKPTTTKKAAPRKTTAKTSAAKTTKKPAVVAKAAPAKRKAPAKKKVVASKKAKNTNKVRSFRVSGQPESFTNFKITRQTVYWIILIAFIIFAQLWILQLQVEVASLLEQQQSYLNEF